MSGWGGVTFPCSSPTHSVNLYAGLIHNVLIWFVSLSLSIEEVGFSDVNERFSAVLDVSHNVC